jgi:pimeloyl-ACP methyl ester carboxylesterase
VIPVLARTHRVLTLSLPGHGDSAPAIGGYAPGADLAPLAADFLDTLGIGPLHLVGNSIGGAVVLRLALADPAREYLEHYVRHEAPLDHAEVKRLHQQAVAAAW